MNTTNTTILGNSTAEEYTKILRGRYITSIAISDDEIRATTLELDNDDTLTIEGNEDCMRCVNGWYHLENAYKRGNHTARIINAHVEYAQDDNYHDGYEAYTIFVMVDGNQTQPPSPRRAATTDPEATTQASHSPRAGVQPRARKQQRRTSAPHHHTKKDKK